MITEGIKNVLNINASSFMHVNEDLSLTMGSISRFRRVLRVDVEILEQNSL